jgi:hypothetical protein
LETYRGGTNNISLILSDVENKSVNVSLSAKFKIDDALMNVLETMHGVIVHH